MSFSNVATLLHVETLITPLATQRRLINRVSWEEEQLCRSQALGLAVDDLL